MGLIFVLLSLLRVIAINLAVLIVASLLDILLSALLLRFSSGALTLVCFAVAGVFAGLFCYSAAVEKAPKEKQEQASLYIMLITVVFCILLFYPIAPLSGSDYSWSFKAFAITQAMSILFFWKGKFYKHE